MEKDGVKILVDGREFHYEIRTGISRVLEGILSNLIDSELIDNVRLAVDKKVKLPRKLTAHFKVKRENISSNPVKSEIEICQKIRKNCDFFLSPYPKLPLIRATCKFVHVIHDIFYITHYKKKSSKFYFDLFRLKNALKKAHLTWYDSEFSLLETKKFLGYSGRNPKVRYPGIKEQPQRVRYNDAIVLSKYGLKEGYILALGNGREHKNLEIIIGLADQINRKIVFVGVNSENQQRLHENPKAGICKWIKFVPDDDLPSIIKKAFCLVQPSLQEGYGYPPLEAMAHGTPAIISDIPVLIETTGKNAISASPQSPIEWKNAIKGLEDKNYYACQVEKGLNWVKKFRGKKSWEKYVLDIEHLIREKH